MKLTKRQIKNIARIFAGSTLAMYDSGGTPANEVGCSEEEWQSIQAEYKKIGMKLLGDNEEVGQVRTIVRSIRGNNGMNIDRESAA